ncbi:MAG: tRNA(m(1)G37)methyltransferase [Pycnora praestabilis]|nr:MAG: tRNA(m(1)G37)methyltransferase [Pycnora praestabilis]
MFRPPINRAMRSLDRSFFRKDILIAAAGIRDTKKISDIRAELRKSRDMLRMERIASVQPYPMDGNPANGRKCLLLRPGVKHDDSSTWSPKLQDLVTSNAIGILPFNLELGYDYWTYHDIMSSILPEDEQDELPTGFSIVGHVAHLNLKDQYLPYKDLIATVILDKNHNIRTVINKIDDVGTHSEYRTFDYEVLAGPPDLNVEVREGECIFQFDYSKVYWNSRLSTEHRRIVDRFNEGEAVCDVMAGVGPFAVPAGRKRVFVWANDLNPYCNKSLEDAILKNKVSEYVTAFNDDGRAFIRTSAMDLLNLEKAVNIKEKSSRGRNPSTQAPSPRIIRTLTQPRTFSHYVMNLPATAMSFLDVFVGLYKGQEALFIPHTETKLPMIHVHCFSTKSDDNRIEELQICGDISARIGYKITPKTPEVTIFDVRDVSPQKRMFCASFRLPAQVAFHE